MKKQDYDRRTVIAGAAAAAGLATLAAPIRAARPLIIPANQPRGRITRALATAETPDWQAVVGTYFTADTRFGAVTLRLASVAALPADPQRPRTLARSGGFLAIFESTTRAVPRGDEIYRLSSAGLQPLDVYFSPAAGSLTALFN